MDLDRNEIKKHRELDLLISEVAKFPTLSNWGILVMENGILVFSSKSTYYQSLINENGEFDFFNLTKIPLANVVPEPSYLIIPLFRTVVRGTDLNMGKIDIVSKAITKLKYWGDENIQAFKSTDLDNLLFTTSIPVYVIEPDTFTSLSK